MEQRGVPEEQDDIIYRCDHAKVYLAASASGAQHLLWQLRCLQSRGCLKKSHINSHCGPHQSVVLEATSTPLVTHNILT